MGRPVLLLLAAAASLGTTGCGQPICDDCGTAAAAGPGSTGSECHDSRGTLTGAAYRYAAPGEPSSAPAPDAIVLLRHTPADTPLQGMADAQGEFAIELEAGDWLVGGEQENCSSSKDIATKLDPCGTSTVELVLDLCIKGM